MRFDLQGKWTIKVARKWEYQVLAFFLIVNDNKAYQRKRCKEAYQLIWLDASFLYTFPLYEQENIMSVDENICEYAVSESVDKKSRPEGVPLLLPEPVLKHLFYAEVECESPIAVGNVDGRELNVYPILGGYFEGQELRGKVLPIGADWNYMSPPNIEVPNARYLLKTDDDVIISIFSQGKSRFTPEQNQAYFHGEALDATSYYFRSNLYLETADDKYKWLNGMVLIGVYGVKENGNICFNAYCLY